MKSTYSSRPGKTVPVVVVVLVLVIGNILSNRVVPQLLAHISSNSVGFVMAWIVVT